MKHVDLLRSLLPPVSYDPNGPNIAAQLNAEGNALDAALASANAVLGAITPYDAGPMLPDWERVLGITPPADATPQQRVDAAVAKLGAVGGLSIPYFTQLGASLGYTINIVEPQYPQCGVARCGDTMYVTDIVWVWCVKVSGSALRAYQARAGTAAAGDPITSFADPVIEAVFNDLKPAFTFVYFQYLGS